ncbi:hypothetical protein UlMin_040755 [Ulmus minor]
MAENTAVEANKEIGEKPEPEFLPMNGGDGTYSYSKNSEFQRIASNTVKEKIDEEIVHKLDVKHLSSISNTIRVADLGCSTGPNTFISMQNVIKAIQLKHKSQSCPNSLEFQVFLSDRVSNDFNTLFNSIPQNFGQFFVAGVPGSFHDRLFPESSLHFVYTSHALHWLSKLPEELLDQNNPAWNKGRIYYENGPREVYNAYASQFYKDIERFLCLRAMELVAGGMMVIVMAGSNSSHVSSFGMTFEFMGSILMEMAKEGLVREAQVDSFNVPIYAASVEEMVEVVEKNGCFSIGRIEFIKSTILEKKDIKIADHISDRMKHSRAGMEGMIGKHFGAEIIDEMFQRLAKKLQDHFQQLVLLAKESGQLFLVLKKR